MLLKKGEHLEYIMNPDGTVELSIKLMNNNLNSLINHFANIASTLSVQLDRIEKGKADANTG